MKKKRPGYFMIPFASFLGILVLMGLNCAEPGSPPAEAAHSETSSDLNAKEELGRLLFFDESLSSPPGQSCATCHDPKAAFANPDKSLPVSKGAIPGFYGKRNDLVVSYAAFIPKLHKDPSENIWIGGMFWDGRVNTLAEQAVLPPLTSFEMANRDRAEFLSKLRKLSYAGRFKDVFGPEALDDTDRALESFGAALEAFQRTDQFNPFSSKYDAYLRGETSLTEQESRGLALFEDEKKGNCAACHPSRKGEDGTHPLFTDWSYDNLGVPKNPENPFYLMPADINPQGKGFVDLGLGDTVKDPAENGKFRVPTLRNVTLTGPYMHNGVFKELFTVVAFYNTRDSGPWPPPEYAQNVNKDEMGDLKLMNEETEDIVAFMKTLEDGWKKEEKK
ncbi:MAG TPA: cytochrome c peroxidase [Acidobacteriota bacterium]|nr:cytochrome c peroxidase [Acidobacteriota bacterium]HNT17513.1 cytochrome c peroxidase [Acidobacteriota bacterium]